MKIGASGLALIKSFESFESEAYLDINGRSTIGWGHLIKHGEIFGTITMEEGNKLLESDIAWVESVIEKHVTVELNQNEFDALASIIYNIGTGDAGRKDGIIVLANGHPSHLLSAINSDDFDAASSEFLKWDHAGGKVVAGLTRRRKAEKVLFDSAVS